MLVGADGRASAVRKHYGIELHSAPIRQYMTGLLVEGPSRCRPTSTAYGTGRDVNWYSFPQGPDRSRLYLAHLDVHRYAGSEGTATFLADLAQAASPDVAMLSKGRAVTPAGDAPVGGHVDRGAVRPRRRAGRRQRRLQRPDHRPGPLAGDGRRARRRPAHRRAGHRSPTSPATASPRFDRHAKQRMAAQTMAELMCSFSEADAGRRLRALPLLGTDETVMAMGAALMAGPDVLPPGTGSLEAARQIMLAA